jgi:hypothetical protein
MKLNKNEYLIELHWALSKLATRFNYEDLHTHTQLLTYASQSNTISEICHF